MTCELCALYPALTVLPSTHVSLSCRIVYRLTILATRSYSSTVYLSHSQRARLGTFYSETRPVGRRRRRRRDPTRANPSTVPYNVGSRDGERAPHRIRDRHVSDVSQYSRLHRHSTLGPLYTVVSRREEVLHTKTWEIGTFIQRSLDVLSVRITSQVQASASSTA